MHDPSIKRKVVEKSSATRRAKNLLWYHDPETKQSRLIGRNEEIPKNYIRGMAPGNHTSRKNFTWVEEKWKTEICTKKESKSI